jgi:hypothetical protein
VSQTLSRDISVRCRRGVPERRYYALCVTTVGETRAAINTLLAVAVGVGLGFLCLELVGAPLLIATLVVGRYATSRSSVSLALPLLGLGFGFAGSVAWFAVRTSGIFDGTAGSGSVYWFGFWFLLGCSMLLIGAGLLLQQFAAGAAPTDQPSP